jgi:DNA-binding transcriptional ArsR family regulator
MEIGFRMCDAADSSEARVLAVAALEEPTRRRLHEHVARQPGQVTRDEAATALGLPRTTAAFHLDRLADEGLLDVDYERRTGRSGPGAGRPSKLYRRSDRHVVVSLPERRYDVAGRLLAAAIEDAEGSGDSPGMALDRRAPPVGSRPRRVSAGNEQRCYEPRRGNPRARRTRLRTTQRRPVPARVTEQTSSPQGRALGPTEGPRIRMLPMTGNEPPAKSAGDGWCQPVVIGQA